MNEPPAASLFCVLLLAVSCITKNSSESSSAPTSPKPAAVADPSAVVLVGAGDIASCDDLKGAEATAKLIDNIPGTVFAAGDLAYPDGSDEQFAKCCQG
jgi:acid phosphatase type 7